MKRKIIAFFSILSIAIVSVGSLVVFAADPPTQTSTSSTFYSVHSTDITKLSTSNGTAKVSAVKSTDTGNWKAVQAQAYQYNSVFDTFVCIDEDTKTGTSSTVQTTISTTNATNFCAVAQIGYTSVAATGTKETIIVNIRKTIDDKYVPKDVYYP